ncbi:FxLD family lantipeptide [Frankia sp. AiPs1]|uniref:FxLD family lanthipeptide n=1 Tax=Frankia sp. AiPa1 TaxID=573492 RepID=UPI00202B5946|nr:FxLD family lanthipeptide [Frankia sp. AiPa1]MCL9760408.1 FxLD family lanthipeptide [Frankia sp. AiPa1]
MSLMSNPTAPAVDPAFDLDVSIIESGPMVNELLSLTDDNCGTTCESACTTTCP